MSVKSQVCALASAGVKQEVIASRLNISASYVSQLLQEEELRAKVTKAQLEVLDSRTQRDAQYDAIEDIILEKTKKIASSLYKPQDILRALQAINKAERRGASSQQLAEITRAQESSVITLDLPERVKSRVVKSQTKEIVSVDGRVLITKDSRLLLEEIQAEMSAPELPLDPYDVDLGDINDFIPQSGQGKSQASANTSSKPLLENSPSENIFEHTESYETNGHSKLESIPVPSRV